MTSPATPEHEAKCRRCGRCCYEKYVIEDCVFTTRRPCPHLNTKTNLCRDYERRFEVNPRCLDVKSGIQWGVFPAHCPYVQGLKNYRPSEEGWLDDRIVRLIERGQITSVQEIRAEMRRGERKKRRKLRTERTD